MTTEKATEKKLTKRDHFNAILSKYPLNEAEAAFIKRELELLEKKSSGGGKATVTQLENQKLVNEIYAEMKEGCTYTISDMIKMFPCCYGLSTSKVSGVIRPLLDVKFEREVEKRKAYFKKIVE